MNNDRPNNGRSPGAISQSNSETDATYTSFDRQNAQHSLTLDQCLDRALAIFKRTLKLAVRQAVLFMQVKGLPAAEEGFYFIKTIVTSFSDSIKTKDHSYSASFQPATAVLNSANHGFVVDGRGGRLSRKDSTRNFLIVSPTGGGKSQTVAIPLLFETDASFCVSDTSGELYRAVAGDLESRGYKVLRINFSDPSVSCFYNPLAHCEPSGCYKIADTIVRTTTPNSNESFWLQSATGLIGLIASALMRGDRKYCHFANVRRIIQHMSIDNGKAVDEIIIRTNDKQLLTDYKAFLAQEDKVKLNVISSALASLLPFASPSVALVTSRDEINWQQLRRRKVCIFLNCNVADTKFYSPLLSLFFLQLSRYILSEIPDPKRDNYIYLILDEFASMRAIPDFGLFVSNCRKALSGAAIFIQSLSQLYTCYSQDEAQTIIANCYSRLYFGGLPHNTAQSLSQELGKYQYETDRGTKVRELLTPDQIRTLPADKGIFMCGNYKPALLTLTPAYKHPYFKRRIGKLGLTTSGIQADTEVFYSL